MAGKIEIRHLRLIQAVAREGSLTRAGACLHLSQSALSHQLLGLEKDLGARLFDRIGKRMVPSEAGLRLLELADTTLRALDEAEASLLQQRSEERPRLRVAPTCYTMYPWLASGLARFAADWPALDLQIAPEIAGSDVEILVADEVDLLIAGRPSGDARFLHGRRRYFEYQDRRTRHHRGVGRFLRPDLGSAEATAGPDAGSVR